MGDGKITKRAFISRLRAGEKIRDIFIVSAVSLMPFRPESKKRGSYLRLILQDNSGSIPAVMWEGAEQVSKQIKPGVPILVQGSVSQYRGELQIVADSIEPEEKAIDLKDFLPQSLRPGRSMELELKTTIDSVKVPELSGLLNLVFQEPVFYQAFIQAPAAKNIHHAYLGGLLEHTLETACFAQAIYERYPRYINRDLLITGALLHDCGKVIEYKWEGLAFGLTDEGKLFGHIVLGAEFVSRQIESCPDFPVALRQELVHMMLSHHGSLEWGSPQLPKTINAFALHQADYLSSEMNHFQNALSKADGSDAAWSPMDRKLGRSLYRGFLDIDEAAAAREGDN